MVAKRYRSYTFLPLYPSPGDQEAARTLRDAANPAARCPAFAVTMPWTGLRFFAAAGAEAQQLDAAWARRVPADSCPVVLLLHEVGLSEYLAGLDAEFVIGMKGGDHRGEYAGFPNVRVVDTADPTVVTRAAMEGWNRPGDPCFLLVEDLKAAGTEDGPEREAGPGPWAGAEADTWPRPKAGLGPWSGAEPDAWAHAEEEPGLEADMESLLGPGPGAGADPGLGAKADAGPSPGSGLEPGESPVSRLQQDQELMDALFGNPRGRPAQPWPEPEPWGDPSPISGDGAAPSPALPGAPSPPGAEGWGTPPVDPLSALAALRPATLGPSDPRPSGGPDGVSPLGLRPSDGPRAVPEAPESAPEPEGARGWAARARSLIARRRPVEVPAEIGDLLLGTRPAPVVVVGSRKGGVGKTALSAGLAQAAGYALDGRAGIAALVDQNINNADQWGRLVLPEGVTTVREIMAQLENGAEFPGPPAYARTPALAVFPESRDPGDGYPPVLVQRFVSDLRSRFVATFVDLPNTLPAFTSAEAAVTAAYVDQCDLVLVPTTDDPNALRGVIEYLEAPSMRSKTAVVPYIVSSEKGIREDPQVLELLREIRSRSAAVVPFPKTEKATLAVVKGTSILDVDPRLRNAYLDLATTVAHILVRGG